MHRPWSEAWELALYGPDGFFMREQPITHFRTSVGPAYAAAMRRLAGLVDEALGRPDPFDVVDLGAGRGELLLTLPDVPARWRLTAVERAPDPSVGLRWLADVPLLTGLLIANEWLDAVPLDVVQDGRVVLVAPTGEERPGPPSPYGAWCQRWWPDARRVEVGLPRDRAWARACSRVRRGLAVAADYGHLRATRRPTLTGYRSGRSLPAAPDGACDVTAHVALDSCAAASGSRLLTQRTALRALGVTGRVPVYDGAAGGYAAGLAGASQAGRLLDPAGLGGFGWLVREVGIPALLPDSCCADAGGG